MFRTRERFIVLVCASLACGGGSDVVSPPPTPHPPAAPATVVIGAHTGTLAVRDTIRFSAEVHDSLGNPIPGAVVMWTSSDSSTLALSASGIAVGHRVGDVVVSAKYGSSPAATTVLEVILRFRPKPQSIDVGEKVSIPGLIDDDDGTGKPDTLLVATILPSDTTKAEFYSIGGTNFLFAKSPGVVSVTLTRGITSLSATVTIKPISFATLGSDCAGTTGTHSYCWGAYAPPLDDWVTADGMAAVSFGYAARPVAWSGNPSLVFATRSEESGCGLSQVGAAYCWGGDGTGVLGDGLNLKSHICDYGLVVADFCVPTPVAVAGGHQFTVLDESERGPQIEWACGLDNSGAAYCWGADEIGELGTPAPDVCVMSYGGGDLGRPCAKIPVRAGGGLTFKSIQLGRNNTCAVTAAGAGYCWGELEWKSLGDSGTVSCVSKVFSDTDPNVPCSYQPVPLPGNVQLVTLSAGFTPCGISIGGAVYCWYKGNPGPSAIAGNIQFASISSYDAVVCGVATDGQGYCWGPDDTGQLGDGLVSAAWSFSPRLVVGGHTWKTIRVSKGRRGACGLTMEGDVYCWGSGYFSPDVPSANSSDWNTAVAHATPVKLLRS